MDKDIISEGELTGPRRFFMDLGLIRHQLTRIQNEGDAHSNACATTAIEILDKALENATGV